MACTMRDLILQEIIGDNNAANEYRFATAFQPS